MTRKVRLIDISSGRTTRYRVLSGSALLGEITILGGYVSASAPGDRVVYGMSVTPGGPPDREAVRRHLLFGAEALIRLASGEMSRTNFAVLPALELEFASGRGVDTEF